MTNKYKAIALIPARAGSLRVKSKNTRVLMGHPLIAYSIAAAKESNVFAEVLVSTDCENIASIAKKYGASVPFLRPAKFATSTSPDIQWIKHAFENVKSSSYEIFSILRPTSPLRSASTIRRAYQQFIDYEVDSLRAVELCREHPGKMWQVENEKLMKPFLDQTGMEIPFHSRQYQDLPTVYIQNSSFEMAWVSNLQNYNAKDGKIFAPFFTDPWEGFSIDYEDDWLLLEHYLNTGKAALPKVVL